LYPSRARRDGEVSLDLSRRYCGFVWENTNGSSIALVYIVSVVPPIVNHCACASALKYNDSC